MEIDQTAIGGVTVELRKTSLCMLSLYINIYIIFVYLDLSVIMLSGSIVTAAKRCPRYKT